MKKRSYRPFVYLTLLCVGALILVGLGAYLFLHWSVERRIAALRAAGQPVTLADLEPPPIPDDQNAAVLLAELTPQIVAVYDQFGAIDYLSDVLLCDLGAVALVVDDNQVLVRKLRRLAELPGYGFKLTDSNDPVTTYFDVNSRGLCLANFILQKSAVVEFLRGDTDQAVRDVLSQIRISRHETTMSSLTRYRTRNALLYFAVQGANLAIQNGRVSPELLEQVDDEAQRDLAEEAELYARILAGERVWAMTDLRMESKPWYFRPLQPIRTSIYLDAAEREMKRVHGGHSWPPEKDNDFSWMPEAFIGEFKDLTPTPAVRVTRLRYVARLRGLRVLIALARRGTASDPATVRIDELGLSAEDITDPFSQTGASLKLKRGDGAWVIYSVGPNQIDNDADLSGNEVGIGVPELP